VGVAAKSSGRTLTTKDTKEHKGWQNGSRDIFIREH
jgi:hypothetical protein